MLKRFLYLIVWIICMATILIMDLVSAILQLISLILAPLGSIIILIGILGGGITLFKNGIRFNAILMIAIIILTGIIIQCLLPFTSGLITGFKDIIKEIRNKYLNKVKRNEF